MKIRYSVVFFVLLILVGCGRTEKEKRERAAIKVEVRVMHEGESKVCRTYGGEVEEGQRATVMAQAGGVVKEIMVENNQYVDSGSTIIRLDDARQESSLASARAALAQAEDGYERVRKMYEGGGVAEVKMVEVQTKLSQAQSMVALAENELMLRTVKAPKGGVVSGMELQEGETVVPGTRLMSIVGRGEMGVRFNVPEVDINLYRVGSKGRVRVGAIGGKEMEGRVTDIDLTADALSRSYSMRMKLNHADRRMLPGMVCRVEMEVEKVRGVMLPAESVHLMKDGVAVWTVKNGRAERRRVKVVSQTGEGVMIGEGIEEGDTVIVSGFQKMYVGARVEIVGQE